MKFYSLLFFIVLIAGSTNGAGQSGVDVSSKEEIEASVKSVPCPQNERLQGVKRLFKEAGAADDEIVVEKFDNDKISNVVVRKKGKSDETIVVGAHYDRTNLGCGVVDNWTGVTIVSHLYKTIRNLDTQKSYVFVAFDREEEGLRGSRQMVRSMQKPALDLTCSMVNFDSFGQALPMSLRNASSPKLLKLAEEMAKEGKFNFIAVDIEGASSDSVSFKEKKISAITLSGLAGDWQQILHSPADQVGKVKMDSVYIGYRFGLAYIARLDAAGCQDYR